MKITRPILPTCSWVWWLTESEPGMLQLKRSEQQFAFKDLMTHLILQFALRIAFRGVLHRCGNQEIHRWKIHWIFFFSHWAEAWTGLGQTYEGENLETNARTTFETNTGECFCGYVCVNDPSAGSPTETLLRLLLPLSDKVYNTSQCNVSFLIPAMTWIIYRIIQSVGATGGVYKGQGRNRCSLMNYVY